MVAERGVQTEKEELGEHGHVVPASRVRSRVGHVVRNGTTFEDRATHRDKPPSIRADVPKHRHEGDYSSDGQSRGRWCGQSSEDLRRTISRWSGRRRPYGGGR